jgi:hypothetical protein
MQLIVCPDSHEHHDESLISPFYEELKHTYEHFSKGISFNRCVSIQHQQAIVAFSDYLEGRKPEFNLDPQRVTSSGLHGWNDRIFVTVSGTLPNEKQNIRRSRSELLVSLGAAFKEWQKGGETYEQAFKREKAAYARSVLNGYVTDMQKRMQVMTGQLPPTLDNVLGSVNGSLISTMEYAARMRGFSHEKALTAIKNFAASGAMTRPRRPSSRPQCGHHSRCKRLRDKKNLRTKGWRPTSM